jgi:predicted regulator of Ras-like GTPase activity (Roadblock/LC7/MglB family)
MPTLPQLLEEDIRKVAVLLNELLERGDATAALLIDKGGFLLTQAGETSQFDPTTLAALASGSFLANQTIAGLVQEKNFNSVYQQGATNSMLIMDVDASCLLVIIFPAETSVGAVRYFAAPAIAQIAGLLKLAWERDPKNGLDLSVLNLKNPEVLFRKKR